MKTGQKILTYALVFLLTLQIGVAELAESDEFLLKLYATASAEGKKTLRYLHDTQKERALLSETVAEIVQTWDIVTADYLSRIPYSAQKESMVKEGRLALESSLNSFIQEGLPTYHKPSRPTSPDSTTPATSSTYPEATSLGGPETKLQSRQSAGADISGVRGGMLATVKDKSNRSVSFAYENKDFTSKSDNTTRKEVDRFMIETSYKWQFNDRNNLTVKVPYSEAVLQQTVGGVSQKYHLHGSRDIKLTHEMTTETFKPKQSSGRQIKWKFDLNLPTGKERLTGEEALVTSAIGETGESFSKGTHGAGFNIGVGLGLDYKRGKAVDKYALNYVANGNYSSHLDKMSYKKSGDNIVLGYTRELQLQERNTLSWTIGNTWTLKSYTMREDTLLGVVRSDTALQQEKRVALNLQMERRPKTFWEIISLEYKQKGYNEIYDVERFEKSDQGDRYYAKWNFRHKLNEKTQIEYGVNAIFGRPNNVVESFNYTTGAIDVARLGYRPESKWEDIDLVFRRQSGGEKDRRKWWYQATVGLTSDSRDYTLSTGLNYTF